MTTTTTTGSTDSTPVTISPQQRCVTCGTHKPLAEFSKNKSRASGVNTACKCCMREYLKVYRANHMAESAAYRKEHAAQRSALNRTDTHRQYMRILQKERYPLHRVRRNEYDRMRDLVYPEKKSAHAAVWYALKTGTLTKPDVCDICKKPPVSTYGLHGHHNSYAHKDRLNVVWVCSACHKAIHLGEIAGYCAPK